MNDHNDMRSRLKTNGIFHQLVWLLVAAAISFLLAVLAFRWNFEPSIDLHFNDTYYVIYSPQLLIALFFGISLILFLAKEYRNKFSRAVPNMIILISGLALIILLTIVQRLFPIGEGYTIYPPLSTLPERDAHRADADNVMTGLIIGMQALIVLVLLHVAFHWGKAKNKSAA